MSGRTARNLRKGNQTVLTGLAIGAVVGLVLSKFTGGHKIVSALIGAAAGTGLGFYINTSNKKNNK